MHDIYKPGYKGVYRCRLCGKEFVGCEMAEEVMKEEKHELTCGVNGSYGTQYRKAHKCADGSVGIADFLGFKIKGA